MTNVFSTVVLSLLLQRSGPIAPSREKADIIASFINDHAYGVASSKDVEGNSPLFLFTNGGVVVGFLPVGSNGSNGLLRIPFTKNIEGWGPNSAPWNSVSVLRFATQANRPDSIPA
jgi:hypothetical protein